jgi:hypothetical protein
MKCKGNLSVYETVINLANSLNAIITKLKEPEENLTKKNSYPEGKPHSCLIVWLALKGETN